MILINVTTGVKWALIGVLFILGENVGEVTSLIQQGGTCIEEHLRKVAAEVVFFKCIQGTLFPVKPFPHSSLPSTLDSRLLILL